MRLAAMRVIIFGPQGIGKGTHADLISNKYGIPHISIGEILREEVGKGTGIGRQIDDVMNSGALVPDEIAADLIKKRLARNDAKKGFVLDGFPRSISQAKDLEKIADVDVVLFISGARKVLVDRLSGRAACEKCGKSYNSAIPSLKPKKEGVCGVDGGRLVRRADDTPEAIKVRLEVFEKETIPLVKFYGNKLVKIVFKEPNAPAERNFEQISKVLDRINDKLESAGSEKGA